MIGLLIGVIVVGVISAVTVSAMRSSDSAATSGAPVASVAAHPLDAANGASCTAERAVLQTAIDTYLAMQGGTTIETAPVTAPVTEPAAGPAARPGAEPPAGAGTTSPSSDITAAPDSGTWQPGATAMQTLVNAGLLRAPSTLFTVTPAGGLVASTAACG
ncbi:MAG: hypothetical protein ABIQ39_09640 [Ilumatobacteraceae bacterium]